MIRYLLAEQIIVPLAVARIAANSVAGSMCSQPNECRSRYHQRERDREKEQCDERRSSDDDGKRRLQGSAANSQHGFDNHR